MSLDGAEAPSPPFYLLNLSFSAQLHPLCHFELILYLCFLSTSFTHIEPAGSGTQFAMLKLKF